MSPKSERAMLVGIPPVPNSFHLISVSLKKCIIDLYPKGVLIVLRKTRIM